MSTVDVVVPCYNYGRYLKACVDSVLSQRDVDIRVLVIDDASPDNTPVVAKQLADPRVFYVRNEVNQGLIRTANKGVMDWATADYVVLLSADDALTPGSLARASRLMDARPDVVMTYGMALMMHDDGPELRAIDAHDAPVAVVPGKDFLRRVCEFRNPVPTPCAVMRTSIQHRIGAYDAEFKHTSDLDMWMRAAAVGCIGVVSAVQGFYRWHTSNMSASYQLRSTGDRAEVLETCEGFARRHGKEFSEFETLLKEMEHRFGEELILIASKSYETSGDEVWQNILKLGEKYCRDYRRSLWWWKFLVKRVVGRRATALIQRIEDTTGLRASAESAAWYDHGAQIGWWPEEASYQV